MPKQSASWNNIEAGDIISFRYQPSDKSKPIRTNTVLVLNPKFPKKLKSGQTKFYVNALKLEESNRRIFTSTDQAWKLLKEMGWISIKSLRNEIYTLEINPTFLGTYGAREKLYNMLMRTPIGRKAEYRSYSWEIAKKNSCFYEPIKLPKKKIMMLENQRQEKLSGNKLWKNVGSEEPEIGLNK